MCWGEAAWNHSLVFWCELKGWNWTVAMTGDGLIMIKNFQWGLILQSDLVRYANVKHGTPTAFLPAGSHPVNRLVASSFRIQICTKFVRIFFQPLSLIQWLNWLGRRSTEKTMASCHPNQLNKSIEADPSLALTTQHPVRKDLEPLHLLHLSHGFPWFSMLWLCCPLVRPEWPSKQKNWSRPQPWLSPCVADL